MEPFSNIFVLFTSLSWPPHTDSIGKALQPGCGVGRGAYNLMFFSCLQLDGPIIGGADKWQ